MEQEAKSHQAEGRKSTKAPRQGSSVWMRNRKEPGVAKGGTGGDGQVRGAGGVGRG